MYNAVPSELSDKIAKRYRCAMQKFLPREEIHIRKPTLVHDLVASSDLPVSSLYTDSASPHKSHAHRSPKTPGGALEERMNSPHDFILPRRWCTVRSDGLHDRLTDI
jgi:hypothetical protein